MTTIPFRPRNSFVSNGYETLLETGNKDTLTEILKETTWGGHFFINVREFDIHTPRDINYIPIETTSFFTHLLKNPKLSKEDNLELLKEIGKKIKMAQNNTLRQKDLDNINTILKERFKSKNILKKPPKMEDFLK